MSLQVKKSWNPNISVTSLLACNEYSRMWGGYGSSGAQQHPPSLPITPLPWDHFLTPLLHLFWTSRGTLHPSEGDGWTRLQFWHECYITPHQEQIPSLGLHCKLGWGNDTAAGWKWTPTEPGRPLLWAVYHPAVHLSLDLVGGGGGLNTQKTHRSCRIRFPPISASPFPLLHHFYWIFPSNSDG